MDRSLLMIPGPIEMEPEVLRALSSKTESHVAPAFIERFGRALAAMREIWRAPDGQPFIVAGSGTFAMEMAAVNLVESGDRVLVASSGFFSDRYVRMLERLDARVTTVAAEPGSAPEPDDIAKALDAGDYKALVATHVDTSTGVRVDAEALARLARERDVLSIFDGVCAAAGERFEMGAWGADLYLTASQKAIGVPPGLALMVASPRALEAWRARKEPVRSLYSDWGEWLPVMEAYEAGRAAYFATPAVNLVNALDVSLRMILDEGIEAVWARHERIGRAFRAAWRALGLDLVAARDEIAANTLSAVRYPTGIDATLVGRVAAEGVVIAGGLHPAIRNDYFRIGHMGRVGANDVLATIGAIERALRSSGHAATPGAGLTAAQAALAGEDEVLG